MVTVKVIKDYYDLELQRSVKAGDTLEVSEARAKVLSTKNNNAGEPLVEIVATTKKGGKKKAAVDE